MIDRIAINRRNRQRGKSTSAELAKYLGGQNVEGLNWPWDVQGQGWRIQSKRDMTGRSPQMVRRLLDAIDFGSDWLRAVYVVTPRVRLTSGRIYVGLAEWVEWHGWDLPQGTLLHAGTPLLVIPLPVFRDIHVGVPLTADSNGPDPAVSKAPL